MCLFNYFSEVQQFLEYLKNRKLFFFMFLDKCICLNLYLTSFILLANFRSNEKSRVSSFTIFADENNIGKLNKIKIMKKV